MYIKKLPRAFNKTPKFTGPKINPQFAEGIKRYNTKIRTLEIECLCWFIRHTI